MGGKFCGRVPSFAPLIESHKTASRAPTAKSICPQGDASISSRSPPPPMVSSNDGIISKIGGSGDSEGEGKGVGVARVNDVSAFCSFCCCLFCSSASSSAAKISISAFTSHTRTQLSVPPVAINKRLVPSNEEEERANNRTQIFKYSKGIISLEKMYYNSSSLY